MRQVRYFERAGIYKGSNFTFNPKTLTAYSYDWWRFVEKIGSRIVFNDFRYSNTTARHQWKIKNLLRDLGIHVDMELEAPGGLQNLNSAIELYRERIVTLQLEILKKGTKKAKNLERKKQISVYKKKILEVKKLIRSAHP